LIRIASEVREVSSLNESGRVPTRLFEVNSSFNIDPSSVQVSTPNQLQQNSSSNQPSFLFHPSPFVASYKSRKMLRSVSEHGV